MSDICAHCWREHPGQCDTRTLEQRKADGNRQATAEVAALIAREKQETSR